MINRIESILYAAAVILLGVTAYFYFTDGGGDRVFAPFILACAAGFVGYRYRLKARVTDHIEAKPPLVADEHHSDEPNI